MPQRNSLRLVVADDSHDVAQELIRLLEKDFEILEAVHDGHALVAAAERYRPDAIVSDFDMPGLNGIEAAKQIIEQGFCLAIVIMTVYNYSEIADAAAAAGIRGYVLKADAGEELIPALRCAAAGETYISRGLRRSEG